MTDFGAPEYSGVVVRTAIREDRNGGGKIHGFFMREWNFWSCNLTGDRRVIYKSSTIWRDTGSTAARHRLAEVRLACFGNGSSPRSVVLLNAVNGVTYASAIG